MDHAPDAGTFSSGQARGFEPGGLDSGPAARPAEPVAYTSVAPPGWTPSAPSPIVAGAGGSAAAAVAPTFGALRRATPADAAIRWRLRAATIDNSLVYGGYLGLCLVLHWRPLVPSHWIVLAILSVAYHFAFEATTGQTIGKSRVGIQVVSVDGGPAGAKAVAIRSVLRVIDQLPVGYASGLVSMIRTGPERRQRLGDVAGRTMVVAIDGRAATRGTPSWFLPTATLLAVALSAYVAVNLHRVTILGFSLGSAGTQPLTAQQEADFIAGCQATGGPAAPCQCVLTQLEADGYDSSDRMRSLLVQVQTAVVDRNPRELPPEMRKAARLCGA